MEGTSGVLVLAGVLCNPTPALGKGGRRCYGETDGNGVLERWNWILRIECAKYRLSASCSRMATLVM